jgi:hypothetical protein
MAASSTDDQGGVDVIDAAASRRPNQSTDAGQRLDADADDDSGTESEPTTRDAGNAKPREQDAGSARDAGKDAATKPMNSGSCCSTSSDPGCGDRAVQECVCALQPRCCSDAWDESCARLVKEKNCEPGVRDCVCGSGDGQWQQDYCCEGGWNSTCESVSIHKCGAREDCS